MTLRPGLFLLRRNLSQVSAWTNVRGIRVFTTGSLCVHCSNVHEVAGWTGRLGGAQRRRKRAKNLQVLAVIKLRSSIGYLSAQIEAF